MIRCDSGANGIVRMEEKMSFYPLTRGFFMETRYLLGLLVIIALTATTAWLYFKEHPFKKGSSPRIIAAGAMFGALSAILYVVPVFTFNLPFFPSFLSIHFDEVPSFIAGFAYGPWAAVLSLLVKTLIKLPMTSTACVGELGDFCLSLLFVLPSAIIYQKKRNLKGVAIGFGVSTVLQLLGSMLLNVYVLIPFYLSFMGFSYEALLAICQTAMPGITNLDWSYAIIAVLPFNLLKDSLVIVITFLVYKGTHKYIKPSRA